MCVDVYSFFFNILRSGGVCLILSFMGTMNGFRRMVRNYSNFSFITGNNHIVGDVTVTHIQLASFRVLTSTREVTVFLVEKYPLFRT